MTPFTDYQFSMAVQKERLQKERPVLVQRYRPKVIRRLCLRLGNWLSGTGNWFIQQGQYQNEEAQDLELA